MEGDMWIAEKFWKKKKDFLVEVVVKKPCEN